MSNTGGESSTGGATANGGTTTTGGAGGATGGTKGGGGTTAAGGATAGAGGVAGSTQTGGATSLGGTSAAGGLTATGGTSSMGGTSGTGGAQGAALRSVQIDMTGMTPHLNQLMEFRIVSASNQLAFMGILDTLPAVTYNYVMPSSIVNGSYRLDFFADLSGDRLYEPPPVDHAWSVMIPTPGDQIIAFAHNTNFTDISMPTITPLGTDFTLQATAMTPHLGQLFELRVIIASTGQVVGRYVLTSVPAADFSVTVPMVIEDLTNYQIDFYADFNGNGHYDPPPTDHAWRLTGVGAPTGLTLQFAHNTTFTDVGF